MKLLVYRSDANRRHDSLGEYVVRFGVMLGDALLIAVAQELFECRPIFLDSALKFNFHG